MQHCSTISTGSEMRPWNFLDKFIDFFLFENPNLIFFKKKNYRENRDRTLQQRPRDVALEFFKKKKKKNKYFSQIKIFFSEEKLELGEWDAALQQQEQERDAALEYFIGSTTLLINSSACKLIRLQFLLVNLFDRRLDKPACL